MSDQLRLAVIELTKQVRDLAEQCSSHVAYSEDPETRGRLYEKYEPFQEACDGILKSLESISVSADEDIDEFEKRERDIQRNTQAAMERANRVVMRGMRRVTKK